MSDLLGLLATYRELHLENMVDYAKFNHFAITHHSTNIEGSTLTEIETRLLLDEQLTPKGKPLAHSLMVQDHYEALLFVLAKAKEKQPLSPAFIGEINSSVLKKTGAVYRTVFGDIDSSKGEFRKSNVSAGNRFFVHFEKVENLTAQLCEKLNERIADVSTIEEQLNLSFDAHFDLVTIHPFYDGNGRTSRLLMNYLQALFDLPLAIVYTEDKAAYFEALEATREREDLHIFREFMASQYQKFLSGEIDLYRKMENNSGKKGYSFIF